MFWEIFYELCLENNTKPTSVVKELSIAAGSVTKWKNGTIPNGDTISKIADYFNVSVDYLLGRTDDPTPMRSIDELLAQAQQQQQPARSIDEILTEGRRNQQPTRSIDEILADEAKTNPGVVMGYGGDRQHKVTQDYCKLIRNSGGKIDSYDLTDEEFEKLKVMLDLIRK